MLTNVPADIFQAGRRLPVRRQPGTLTLRTPPARRLVRFLRLGARHDHGQNCWISYAEQVLRGACRGRGHAEARILALVAALPDRRACGPRPVLVHPARPGTPGARPGRTPARRHRRALLAARAGPAAQEGAAAVCVGTDAPLTRAAHRRCGAACRRCGWNTAFATRRGRGGASCAPA